MPAADDDQSVHEEFITVAAFDLPHDAHMLIGRLNAGGIDAIMQDRDGFTFLNWPFNTGVRVLVPVGQAEQARAIIAASSSPSGAA